MLKGRILGKINSYISKIIYPSTISLVRDWENINGNIE